MSTRAIAPVVGVSQKTISRDIQAGASHDAPGGSPSRARGAHKARSMTLNLPTLALTRPRGAPQRRNCPQVDGSRSHAPAGRTLPHLRQRRAPSRRSWAFITTPWRETFRCSEMNT